MTVSRRTFLRTTAVAIAGAGLPIARAADAVAAPTSAGPAALLAQGLSDTSARLVWSPVPNATGYRIYRNKTLVSDQIGTTYVDRSRAAATTYSYAVTAKVGGSETASTSAQVTTQAAVSTTAPSAVTGLAATGVSATALTLTWRSSGAASVRGYRVLRGAPGTDPATWTQIGTSDGSPSFPVTNLFANRTYGFAVRCVDRNGTLSPPTTITVTTAAGSAGAAPAAPSATSVSLRVASSSRVDVIWAASTSTVAAYDVLRDGAVVARLEQPLRRNFSDTGLAPGSTHTYQIRAVDSYGQTSAATTAKSATTKAAGSVLILRGPYLQHADATSVLVCWWTSIPAPSSVSYGVGGLTSTAVDQSSTLFHAILVGGLQPSTVYQYRVASGGAVSATNSMRTARAARESFTLHAVGDYGGGSPQETRIANLIAAAAGDVVLTAGDNVYPDCQDPDPANVYSDFDARFYKPYAGVLATSVLCSTNGNKDYYGDGALWRNLWMRNNQYWYALDWGDLHVLVLDTEQDFSAGSPQYQFAQADLSANARRPWRLVVAHRPPYSSATANSSSNAVRTSLVPLFEQYHTHLVISGNTHNYERTLPLVGGVPTAGGVTYVVTGGGGNGLVQFSAAAPSWSAFRKATYEFLRLSVTPTKLSLVAIDDAGATVDSVVIGP